MTRLRLHLAAAMLAAIVAAGAGAVDFRWTSGFGQGVTSAQIRNQAGSSVLFSCNSGGLPPVVPSLGVEIRGRSLPGAKVYQFVVDGRNHAVSLTDGWLNARAQFEVNAVTTIADALVRSNSQSFVVEVPEAGVSDRFSLLNVREALGQRAGATLADCS